MPACLSSFLRMFCVVAFITEAYQVLVIKSQLRIFIIVFDVMYCLSFTLPAITLAPLAHIAVTSEYGSSFTFPCFRFVKRINHINV